MLRMFHRSATPGHNSMTYVDTFPGGCLGSTRRTRAGVCRPGCALLVTTQSSEAPRGAGRPVRSPRERGTREALHVKLSKRRSALVAAGIAAAMMLTACGGSDETSNEGGTAASGGSFSIYVGEPENPLVPGNTSESEGSQVIEALWTGLVQYGDDSSVQY